MPTTLNSIMATSADDTAVMAVGDLKTPRKLPSAVKNSLSGQKKG
jgi:hypothetical protein